MGQERLSNLAITSVENRFAAQNLTLTKQLVFFQMLNNVEKSVRIKYYYLYFYNS